MKKLILLASAILITTAGASAQTAGKREPAEHSTRRAASKSSATGRRVAAPGVLRVGPSSIYLKNGLSANEVVRLLGAPVLMVDRREGESLYTTLTFERGEGRVLVAEFLNNRLVDSHTQPGESLARGK